MFSERLMLIVKHCYLFKQNTATDYIPHQYPACPCLSWYLLYILTNIMPVLISAVYNHQYHACLCLSLYQLYKLTSILPVPVCPDISCIYSPLSCLSLSVLISAVYTHQYPACPCLSWYQFSCPVFCFWHEVSILCSIRILSLRKLIRFVSLHFILIILTCSLILFSSSSCFFTSGWL